MWIWGSMSIFLIFFTVFAYVSIDSGAGTKMTILLFLCMLLFFIRYRMYKQNR